MNLVTTGALEGRGKSYGTLGRNDFSALLGVSGGMPPKENFGFQASEIIFGAFWGKIAV